MSQNQVNDVQNLRLKYPGEDGLIFSHLSLTIHKGDKLLLLGPSGCGKSTLLQVLSGLVPQVIPLPMKCDALVVPERWAYVFQDPDTQFCMSYVDEELAFVLENQGIASEDMPDRIRYYLESVGLDPIQSHILIQSLSQGMKQRLAIAAALALQPDVLYLDEPTSLLDPYGTGLVWETIRNLPGDITLVIVEHKIDEVLSIANRVVLINEHGEIEADQSPDIFFRENQQRLAECGVWYPGIWDTRAEHQSENTPNRTERRLTLHSFQGFRRGRQMVSVESAYVDRAEWISIIGANGAGKSTLLLAIMRLIETRGYASVCGREATQTKQIANLTGFVFQNPEMQFITESVKDEIVYSILASGECIDAAYRQAFEILKKIGLEEYADRHPYQLSIGQKRRLSVATAAVGNKQLLLLDEPTFGLDALSTFRLLEILEELRKNGTAIIMVTHDLELAHRYSTRIWQIEDGIVREAQGCG